MNRSTIITGIAGCVTGSVSIFSFIKTDAMTVHAVLLIIGIFLSSIQCIIAGTYMKEK